MVIKVEFPKELEQKFRETAMRKFGFSKGALKKASEEAISAWVRMQSDTVPRVENPITLIDGMLSHLRQKYTSVELQHEARDFWGK